MNLLRILKCGKLLTQRKIPGLERNGIFCEKCGKCYYQHHIEEDLCDNCKYAFRAKKKISH
jgi:hypothetical protein